HTRFSRDWSSDVCSSDLEREVDVGRVRVLQAVDLDERGHTGGDLTPDRGGVTVERAQLDRPVAGRGDAVEDVPVAVESPPQRERSEERRVGNDGRARRRG